MEPPAILNKPAQQMANEKHLLCKAGYTVRLVSGRTYVIRANGKPTQHGSLVDPYMVIKRVSDDATVASDNDGGQRFNTKITYTPTGTEDFHIQVSAHTAGERGSYRVKVT